MKVKILTSLLAAVLVAAMGLWSTEGMTMNEYASNIYVPRGSDDRQKFLEARDGWETIRNVYAPTVDLSDWQKLVERRRKDHWKPGNSAHETALSWFNANPELPREINTLLGGAELLVATPEHETPLAGKGGGSHSDVLAFVNMRGVRCAVTVEGKKDSDDFDDTVEAWFKEAKTEGARDNRTKRLGGIYDELGLTNPDADKIRYQLLHRAAAAVIEAKRFNADCAAMVVQSFSPKHTGFDDFAEFLKLFGINSAKRDTLYETDMPGMTLYFGWASSAGTVATAPVKSEVQQPAVTATSAESVASTPSSQSSQTSPIMFVIGGVIVLALVGVVVFFAWQRSRENAGKAFESYVKSLLCGRENVKLTKPTDKFDYPDFEMTIRDEKRRISLECKWTKSFYQGNYNVIRDPKQLRKYEAYQKDYGQPFFIVLGVGGTGKKPHHLYTIPLEELPQTKLNYEQLKVYLQKEGSDFSYKPSTNRLTISR